MPSVQLVVENAGYNSATLTEDHLGANLLFHSDSVTAGSDFDGVITESGIRFIRYPGGTIAEEYFDLTNPNSTTSTNIIDVMSGATNVRVRQDVVPLEDFLAYNHAIGSRASIVLPTYRFFDPDTGLIRPGAEAEVREFIRELLTGTYGPADDIVLELGNEWYQHRFDWSVEEFGFIQATMASWIDDEARALGLRGNVTILAQAGRSEAENDVLSSFFEGAAQTTIDGVLTHLYGTNATGNPLGIGSGIDNRLDTINDIWSGVLGPNFELAVTEWNVGENGENDTSINGLMRLAPLMRLFGEMLSNGVDLAMIWSTQTNGPAGLSGAEGTGSGLSPTGYFYSMLTQSIQGMRLIDTGDGFTLRDNTGETVGYTYSFVEDENLVSYFVSGVEGNISLDVDLTAFQNSDAYVYATILGAAPGENGTDYWSEASIRHLTNIDLSTNAGWEFVHTLGAYELVELHVVVGEGVSISGDTQNAIADRLSGSGYADQLFGGLGNDTLSGADGDDLLRGGAGADLLSGENDHDTLEGGAGNDTLEGGHGRDYLDGGLGNDLLDGGNWHDTLVGGEGHDTLLGGAGNDLLRMGDAGGHANGGLGQDTLSFWNTSAGVTIWAGDGVVELEGIDIVEFANIEIFEGSQFADRISIKGDGDTFFGADGNDTFELHLGSENLVQAGNGDDLIFIYSNENSRIFANGGHDHFHTFSGSNSLIGGTGNDTFALHSSGQDELIFNAGDGADTVEGFESGEDQIVFYGLDAGDMHIVENSAGTILDFGADGSIFLDGTFGIDQVNDLLFV